MRLKFEAEKPDRMKISVKNLLKRENQATFIMNLSLDSLSHKPKIKMPVGFALVSAVQKIMLM